MKPIVSVCIPVYNGAKYLTETLESLLKQSLKNIEILISDNASTDSTMDIASVFAAKDARIVILSNETNLGYCKNIISTVNTAKSEIVAIFHADDIYHPDILKQEYKILKTNPDVSGVFSLPTVFNGSPENSIQKKIYKQLKGIGPYNSQHDALIGNYEDYLPILLEYGNIFACPSFMTRKKDFLELGGFSDKYPSNEDLELWIKYLKTGRLLAIVNNFLLYYRLSDNNASSYWKSRPELGVMYTVIDEMIINKSNLNNSQLKKYKKNKAIGYVRASLNAALQGNKVKARILARSSRTCSLLLERPIWLVLQYCPIIGANILRLSMVKKNGKSCERK
jgi:glycosyltransferase involved in cell wall biosynthesis